MKSIKKILVATDFSKLSVAAMELAKTFAGKFGAKIHLVHVVDTGPIIGVPNIDLTYGKVAREMERRAKDELKNFAAKHLRGMRDVGLVVLKGIPHDELVRFIKAKRFDLVIMATHGRTGLAHALIGSVAERVVRHSPVPVLMVKPEEMHETSPRKR